MEFIKIIIAFLIKVFNTFIPKKNNLFIFNSNEGYSGNAKALFLFLKENYPSYKLIWVLRNREDVKSMRLHNQNIIVHPTLSFRGLFYLLNAKYILGTHMEFSRCKAFIGQKYINLWHGMPLKKMGFMTSKEVELQNYKNIWGNSDSITVTSEFFAVILSAQFGTDYKKFKIVGNARNDFLFDCDGKKNLNKLFPNFIENKKIVLYCPTFRKMSLRRTERIDSGYDSDYFINKYFNRETELFFKENKIFCLIKFHPFDISPFKKNMLCINGLGESIKILSDKMLKKNNLSLHEILNGVDLLITDYSSIYIDFLLLERPVMFITDDLKEYQLRRGIIFNSYNFFTPGPKVNNINEFKKQISILLLNKNYFKQERQEKINLFHEIKRNFCMHIADEILKDKEKASI